MLIDNEIYNVIQEKRDFYNQDFSVLLEDVQQPEAAPDAQQPEAAPQQPDENSLIAMQIDQTQEVFTKIYLIKRIDQIKKYIGSLISLMEMKFDLDEFEQLKRLNTYIDTLDEFALILPSETLYQMVVGFEFDLLDLIAKINKIIPVPAYEPAERTD